MLCGKTGLHYSESNKQRFVPRRWELAFLRELYNTLEEKRPILEMNFIYTGSRERHLQEDTHMAISPSKNSFYRLNIKQEESTVQVTWYTTEEKNCSYSNQNKTSGCGSLKMEPALFLQATGPPYALAHLLPPQFAPHWPSVDPAKTMTENVSFSAELTPCFGLPHAHTNSWNGVLWQWCQFKLCMELHRLPERSSGKD